jgi:hypothetical protein
MEHEIKFIFSNHRAHLIAQWLKQTCSPDQNFPYNIVSSIYYDTRDWQFLANKINSDYYKTKVRIRWYREPAENGENGVAFIELKNKIGAGRQKMRLEAPYSSEWFSKASLDDPKFLDIPIFLKSQGALLEYPVYPVFLVRYERYRFIDLYSGTRVCVDYNISTPKVNKHFLSTLPSLGHVSQNPLVSQLRTAVIEVKGVVDHLPTTLGHLVSMGCKKSSFSKYLACYQHITGAQF